MQGGRIGSGRENARRGPTRRGAGQWSLALAAAVLLAASSPAEARFSPQTLEIQTRLTELGYQPGVLDGLSGRATSGAIRQYQTDWGMTVDGEESEQLLTLLRGRPPVTLPVQDRDACFVISPQPRAQESVSWSGACENGRPEGQGTLTWRFVRNGQPVEETFQGQLKAGRADGLGTLTRVDGAVYVGAWSDGRPNGQGKLTTPRPDLQEDTGQPRADVYNGEWRDGLPHGQGEWVSGEGDTYTGLWSEGVPDRS